MYAIRSYYADVADPELDGGVVPVGPHVPPDLGGIGDGIGFGQGPDQLLELVPRVQVGRDAGARKVPEYDLV